MRIDINNYASMKGFLEDVKSSSPFDAIVGNSTRCWQKYAQEIENNHPYLERWNNGLFFDPELNRLWFDLWEDMVSKSWDINHFVDKTRLCSYARQSLVFMKRIETRIQEILDEAD